MKLSNISLVLICALVLIAAKCSTDSDSGGAINRSNLKLLLTDSLNLEYDDGNRRLPESIQELCDVLVSDDKDCAYTVVLDPLIYRTDLDKTFSLKTTIEKGGSKDVSNPKVIGRLIKRNLEELNVPKDFSKAYSGKNAGFDVANYVKEKVLKDSVLILNTEGLVETYTLNGKTYKSLNSVEEIRNRMKVILCQNEKVNFVLLINPPIVIAQPPKSLSARDNHKAQGHPVRLNSNSSGHRNYERPVGDLTILKGSEGCDICTRYYTAFDASGRRHEIREENSTNCCPCDKIVEIRGRNYQMNCDGSPHLKLIN